MTYYIYHIPGKKIGVTCDLNNRVTVQQGYGPDEYEILESSSDVDYISDKERILQREYGYRVDMVPYRKLNRKIMMDLNVTEQTTTFPCPVDKLKGRLFDMIGYEWTTEHGNFEITPRTIDWIMKNVKTSMFNNDRSYVYNKAFAVFTKNLVDTKETKVVLVSENQKIINLDSESVDLLNNSHPLTHGTILYNLSKD